MKYWKVSKFVKIASDLSDCEQIISTYARDFTLLFQFLSSRSIAYPNVSWPDLQTFLVDSKVIDGNKLSSI